MVLTNRLQVRSANAATTRWDSGFYRYDGAQNIRRIGESYYAYDDAHRLRKAQLQAVWSTGGVPTNHSEDYAYDQYDNMTSRTRDGGAPQGYFYTQAGYAHKNRLLHTPGHGGVPNLVYDPRGSVTRLGTVPGSTLPAQEVKYDGLAMPWRELVRESTVQEDEHVYLYGPGNLRFMRLEKQNAPTQTGWTRQHMLRDLNGKVLRTWSVSGWGAQQQVNFEEDYVYGPEGLFGSADIANAKKSYFKDHLGTPRIISTGATVAGGFHNYYPFGDEIQNGATFRDDRFCKYTGHERDAHGKSDYMLARSYGYELQRFLSVDPGRDGWNLYAYAANSPLKYVDPDGREVQLVYSAQNGNNFFGHVTLAVNNRAYSYDTRDVRSSGDWGVPLGEYLSVQNQTRESTILTLDFSPEQEAKIEKYLLANNPYESDLSYDPVTNSCVAQCENALEAGGLPDGPLKVRFGPGGTAVLVREPGRQSLTPRELVRRVRMEGLVTAEDTEGEEIESILRSFLNTGKQAASRFRSMFLD